MNSDVAPPVPRAGPVAPMDILRSRRYLGLLVVAAVLGVPIWAVAYWFLALVGAIQGWAFTSLAHSLGLATLFLGSTGLMVIPLVIVGVVVSYVSRSGCPTLAHTCPLPRPSPLQCPRPPPRRSPPRRRAARYDASERVSSC